MRGTQRLFHGWMIAYIGTIIWKFHSLSFTPLIRVHVTPMDYYPVETQAIKQHQWLAVS